MRQIYKLLTIKIQRAAACVARPVQRLRLIAQIRQERVQLARLSERELKDIGIDKYAACQESQRDLLDIPVSRLPCPESYVSTGLVKSARHSEHSENSLLKA